MYSHTHTLTPCAYSIHTYAPTLSYTHIHAHTRTYTHTQTGPKGVLTDFYRTQEEDQRKKVLEEKKRRELIEEHIATIKSTVRDLSSYKAAF